MTTTPPSDLPADLEFFGAVDDDIYVVRRALWDAARTHKIRFVGRLHCDGETYDLDTANLGTMPIELLFGSAAETEEGIRELMSEHDVTIATDLTEYSIGGLHMAWERMRFPEAGFSAALGIIKSRLDEIGLKLKS